MTKEYLGGFVAAVALVLSSLAAVWGIVALCPGSLFATSPVYKFYPGSEELWGLFTLVAAASQAWGAVKGKAPWFLIGAALLISFWVFGAILFFQADYHSAAGYSYLVIAIWQTFPFLWVCKETGRWGRGD